MKKLLEEHRLCAVLVILLLLGNVLGWGGWFSHQSRESSPPYGSFATSRVVNEAVFLILDGNEFQLYRGENEELIDEGAWVWCEDTALLTGGIDVYDLVVKGNALYLCGGEFTRITRFDKTEDRPIRVSVSTQ